MIINNTATALYSTLTGGTALTALLSGTAAVYDMQAVEKATYPYVVYNHQGGGPTNETKANLENNVWWIRAYSKTSAKNAALIFTQVDALLHKKNITITNATTIWLCREENIALVESNPAGEKIFTCGGMYRIMTTNTT